METADTTAGVVQGASIQDKSVTGTLGVVGSLVLNLAPEIGRYLFGPASASGLAAVQAAVSQITGSSDPDRQVEVLADPDKAASLRIALAKLAAEQAEVAIAQRQATMLARLSTVIAPSPGPARPGENVAYGAPLVSMVVLLTFGSVVTIALTRTMPQGAEPVLNVLLGTLGAMATSVVGYWVGSSAGSARKEERLANLAERN